MLWQMMYNSVVQQSIDTGDMHLLSSTLDVHYLCKGHRSLIKAGSRYGEKRGNLIIRKSLGKSSCLGC